MKGRFQGGRMTADRMGEFVERLPAKVDIWTVAACSRLTTEDWV